MRKNTTILIIFLACLVSCNEPENVRKELIYHGMQISWYYKSFITSTRAYVQVKTKNNSYSLIECNEQIITDINLVSDTIFIKMFKPSHGGIYIVTSYYVGLFVKIDSTATVNEYNKIYQPEFYRPEKK